MEVDCKLEDPRPPLEESCVQLGDVKDMRLEAEAVVSDVLFAVTHMCVSPALSSTLDVAYINTETREGSRYCLELSEAGLRVVGHDFDQVDESLCCPYHETVYSLLDSLSPGYREAFGNALLQRLESLKQSTQQLDTCGQVEIRTREESAESSYLASRDGELSAASAAP